MTRDVTFKEEAVSDLSPPWILFCDKGKPVAILPAGRPGEVCNVSKLTMKQACSIVNAANQTIRDKRMELVESFQALTRALENLPET